jgi:hypothetical protein
MKRMAEKILLNQLRAHALGAANPPLSNSTGAADAEGGVGRRFDFSPPVSSAAAEIAAVADRTCTSCVGNQQAASGGGGGGGGGGGRDSVSDEALARQLQDEEDSAAAAAAAASDDGSDGADGGGGVGGGAGGAPVRRRCPSAAEGRAVRRWAGRITHGAAAVEDRRSTFHAHLAPVAAAADVREVPRCGPGGSSGGDLLRCRPRLRRHRRWQAAAASVYLSESPLSLPASLPFPLPSPPPPPLSPLCVAAGL